MQKNMRNVREQIVAMQIIAAVRMLELAATAKRYQTTVLRFLFSKGNTVLEFKSALRESQIVTHKSLPVKKLRALLSRIAAAVTRYLSNNCTCTFTVGESITRVTRYCASSVSKTLCF